MFDKTLLRFPSAHGALTGLLAGNIIVWFVFPNNHDHMIAFNAFGLVVMLADFGWSLYNHLKGGHFNEKADE